MWMRFRPSLRLIPESIDMRIARSHHTSSASTLVVKVVHRFEESIAGRPYLIEVAFVADERWRADIVRIPGLPTAMMPFYGRTPDEAAKNLTDWLTRAHQRAATFPPR